MEQDWLTTEKLVKLLEESISPESTVDHNTKLPVLNSSLKIKRQFDIVIRSGKKPRGTLTVVEVQKRKSKFSLTFFQGLITKMESVGAQHLICVSTAGFTKSIKELASQKGETVKLITLQKQEINQLPPIFPNFQFVYSRPVLFKPNEPEIVFTGNFGFYLYDVKFIESNSPDALFSFEELIQYYFKLFPPQNGGIAVIEYPFDNNTLKIRFENNEVELEKFSCEVDIEIETDEMQVEILSYEQLDYGTLGWIVEGKIEVEGIPKKVRASLIPEENHSYVIKKWTIEV